MFQLDFVFSSIETTLFPDPTLNFFFIMNFIVPNIFACDQCKFVATARIQLNFHKKKKHPVVAEEKKLKCSKCDFESGYSYHMKKHEEKCGSTDPILQCDGEQCEFKISSTFLLIRHERTEHGITTRTLPLKKSKAKTSKCQKCGQICRKNYMKKHIEKCSQSGT